MLHQHVGQNLHVRAVVAPVTSGLVGLALNDAFVGHHDAVVGVGADEGCPGDHGHGEGAFDVVAEHIDSHWHSYGFDHTGDCKGHGSHGMGLHPALGVGGVVEVLHDDSVDAALLQGGGLLPGAGH